MKKRLKVSPILVIIMFVLGSLPITLADDKIEELMGLTGDALNSVREYKIVLEEKRENLHWIWTWSPFSKKAALNARISRLDDALADSSSSRSAIRTSKDSTQAKKLSINLINTLISTVRENDFDGLSEDCLKDLNEYLKSAQKLTVTNSVTIPIESKEYLVTPDTLEASSRVPNQEMCSTYLKNLIKLYSDEESQYSCDTLCAKKYPDKPIGFCENNPNPKPNIKTNKICRCFEIRDSYYVCNNRILIEYGPDGQHKKSSICEEDCECIDNKDGKAKCKEITIEYTDRQECSSDGSKIITYRIKDNSEIKTEDCNEYCQENFGKGKSEISYAPIGKCEEKSNLESLKIKDEKFCACYSTGKSASFCIDGNLYEYDKKGTVKDRFDKYRNIEEENGIDCNQYCIDNGAVSGECKQFEEEKAECVCIAKEEPPEVTESTRSLEKKDPEEKKPIIIDSARVYGRTIQSSGNIKTDYSPIFLLSLKKWKNIDACNEDCDGSCASLDPTKLGKDIEAYVIEENSGTTYNTDFYCKGYLKEGVDDELRKWHKELIEATIGETFSLTKKITEIESNKKMPTELKSPLQIKFAELEKQNEEWVMTKLDSKLKAFKTEDTAVAQITYLPHLIPNFKLYEGSPKAVYNLKIFPEEKQEIFVSMTEKNKLKLNAGNKLTSQLGVYLKETNERIIDLGITQITKEIVIDLTKGKRSILEGEFYFAENQQTNRQKLALKNKEEVIYFNLFSSNLPQLKFLIEDSQPIFRISAGQGDYRISNDNFKAGEGIILASEDASQKIELGRDQSSSHKTFDYIIITKGAAKINNKIVEIISENQYSTKPLKIYVKENPSCNNLEENSIVISSNEEEYFAVSNLDLKLVVSNSLVGLDGVFLVEPNQDCIKLPQGFVSKDGEIQKINTYGITIQQDKKLKVCLDSGYKEVIGAGKKGSGYGTRTNPNFQDYSISTGNLLTKCLEQETTKPQEEKEILHCKNGILTYKDGSTKTCSPKKCNSEGTDCKGEEELETEYIPQENDQQQAKPDQNVQDPAPIGAYPQTQPPEESETTQTEPKNLQAIECNFYQLSKSCEMDLDEEGIERGGYGTPSSVEGFMGTITTLAKEENVGIILLEKDKTPETKDNLHLYDETKICDFLEGMEKGNKITLYWGEEDNLQTKEITTFDRTSVLSCISKTASSRFSSVGSLKGSNSLGFIALLAVILGISYKAKDINN